MDEEIVNQLKRGLDNLSLTEKESLLTALKNDRKMTLPNGRVITFNDEQHQGIQKIRNWLKNNKTFFTLSGFAGSGKTTIIKKILDENKRKRIVVSAPTHKAKKVVMKTTGQDGETLQSLLGLRPDVDLDDFNPNDPKFNPIAKPKMDNYNFIIIDEASMINEDLFEMIKELAKYIKGIKILFMGDPAQIPPVGEKESIVFDDETGIEDVHQLTQVMRQEDGNPLALVYDSLRKNLMVLNGGFERKSAMNSKGEGVIFTDNNKEFRLKLKEFFTSEEYKKDHEFVKVIAWRNVTVMKSNKIIREYLFGKKANLLEVDDILMAYRSIRDSRQFFNIIDNSADYRVINVSERTENEYKMWGYEVTLRETLLDGEFKFQDVFILDHLDHDNLHHYAEMHDFLRDMGKLNKSKWKDYYSFRRNNLIMTTIKEFKDGSERPYGEVIAKDLDYGYSITGHKCLSENSCVLTDNGNVLLKDIKIGDYVSIGSGRYKPVRNKFNSGIKKSYELITKSGYKIRCSEDHRILDSRNNFKPLKEFEIGEFIPVNRNEPLNKRILEIFETYYYYDEIVSIELVGEEQMYDLEIEDIHRYVADGFIVHNSQGSTYQHVMVLEDDINLNPTLKERNQIKYVALTRPSKTATVFTRLVEN